MGGTISAVWTNAFGAPGEGEEDEVRVVPGQPRLALRDARRILVRGKGKKLLEDLEPWQFDAEDPREDPNNPHRHAEKLKGMERFAPPLSPARGSPKRGQPVDDAEGVEMQNKHKKQVRRVFYKKAYGGHPMAGRRGPRGHATARDLDAIDAGRRQLEQTQKEEREELAIKLALQEKRVKEAKGCRGKFDEVCLVGLCIVYAVVAMWSAIVFAEVSSDGDMTYYDPATDSYLNIPCNVDREKLRLWWRMNYVWTGCLFGLTLFLEFFYYFIAPYSPRGALTIFAKSFVRSIAFIVWLILVVIWVVVGSIWFWKANGAKCGKINVYHARALLIAQYIWLAVHSVVFFKDFDNLMAMKRLWCFAHEVNTAVIEDLNERPDVMDSEDDEDDEDDLDSDLASRSDLDDDPRDV